MPLNLSFDLRLNNIPIPRELRINRSIREPKRAIETIKQNPIIADLVKNNIAGMPLFGANGIYNSRMFFALRNGETNTNRVEFYCMGAKYCDVEFDPGINDYKVDFEDTYKGQGTTKEAMFSEIQKKNFPIGPNSVQLFNSLFYELNPLCGVDKTLFLLDIKAEFTRQETPERMIADLVFLVVQNGLSHLLFVESKRANYDNDSIRIHDGQQHSETIKDIYQLARTIEADRGNVIDQYNQVIEFYNGLGCNLPLLIKDDCKIKIGLCVFYQEDDRPNVVAEAQRLNCLTCTVQINEAGYLPGNQIDGGFEERSIAAIKEMAKAFD